MIVKITVINNAVRNVNQPSKSCVTIYNYDGKDHVDNDSSNKPCSKTVWLKYGYSGNKKLPDIKYNVEVFVRSGKVFKIKAPKEINVAIVEE